MLPQLDEPATGTFRTEPQRPGDYFLAAFGPGTPLPQARERFAHLAETAERITLAGEEERTLDLRLVRPR